MKISKEAKIGLFAAFSLAALYFGYNFLRGRRIFSSVNKYYVVYNNIDGISKSTPVHFKGLKVGQVEDLKLIKNDSASQILCTLLIDNDIVLSKTSEAQIVSKDLLGGKSISLLIHNLTEPLIEGDTLIGTEEITLSSSISGMINPIKEKTEVVMISLNKVLGEIEKVFENGGTKNLTTSLQSLSEILANLKSTSGQIDQLLAMEKSKIGKITTNIQSVTETFQRNSSEIETSLKNVRKMSDSLAQAPIKSTIEQLNITSKQLAIISQKIEKGEGTAGKLVNDPALYDNLNKSTMELQALLKDLKENPKRYINISVFGGKEKKKK